MKDTIFIPCMSNPIDPASVFIIIPAFNEHGMIRKVLDELLSFHYNIVVVDDGSSPPLDALVHNMPIFLLRHKVNLGQGAAIQTGIEYAIEKHAGYVITFDADGQHQANDIPALLNPLQNQVADIVTGSRFLEGSSHNMPADRKVLIQLARVFNFLFTGLWLTDAHNGLRAMTAKAAMSIQLKENGMAHATELLSVIRKARLRHLEVPVHIRYTSYSTAKGQTVWSGFRVFFDILLNKIFK
jgi:polyprenyl-phospho-N-acetylgalactosaminyl synthase